MDDQGHSGESIVLDVSAVPEPAPLALFASGALLMTWRRRKAVAASVASWFVRVGFGGRTADAPAARPA